MSKKIKEKLKILGPAASLFLKLVIAVAIIFGAYNFTFIGRVLPNVSVAGVDISGLTPEEATRQLQSNLNLPNKIILKTESDEFEINFANIDFQYQLESTSYSAYRLFRTGNISRDTETRINALWETRDIGILTSYNKQKLDEAVSVLAGQVAIPPVYPSIKVTDKKLEVVPGKNGVDIDTEKLKRDILYNLTYAKPDAVIVQTKNVDTTLTPEESNNFLTRANLLLGKKLELTFEFTTFTYTDSDLFTLINPKGGYSQEKIDELIATIATSVERAPQNPHFVFDGGKVKEFTPAKPGVAINKAELVGKVKEKLAVLETGTDKLATVGVPASLTEPDITTDKVNDLGIKELIGRGSSRFTGSIPSRVYNVNLAATRLDGVLIKPGETFSFNNSLGDISKLTGYKEAYVIKEGKTVLGDGGGVCQVSTTLFRAALNAGLPITERRAHAYRVGYYEQDAGPGLDATIYSPTTDFKFENNTPGHILIQAYPDTTNLTLVFELYGTNDGRVATVTKPVTSGVSAPPEDLYVDDPTLPAGVIRQIERRAAGAKSVFEYKVERNGEIIYEKTFVSNYRPWQAVYLRGTGPTQ